MDMAKLNKLSFLDVLEICFNIFISSGKIGKIRFFHLTTMLLEEGRRLNDSKNFQEF